MRRRYFTGSVVSVTFAALAGCVDEFTSEGTNGEDGEHVGQESTDDQEEGNGGGPEADAASDAEKVLRTFLEAGAEGDVETQEQYLHDESTSVVLATEPAELEIHTIDQRTLGDIEFGTNTTRADMETAAAEVDEHAFVYAEFETDEHGIEDHVFLLTADTGAWQILGIYSGGGGPTGDESTEQVGDNIQILSALGTVGDSETIEIVRLTVTLAAGSSEVDLSEAEIEFQSQSEETTLTHGTARTEEMDTDAIVDGTFATVSLSGDNPEILEDGSDRIDIVFAGGELEAGDTAEVTVTLQSGVARQHQLSVPDHLDDTADAVRL